MVGYTLMTYIQYVSALIYRCDIMILVGGLYFVKSSCVQGDLMRMQKSHILWKFREKLS